MSNSSEFNYRKDLLEEAMLKTIVAVLIAIIINYINGTLLYTYFTNQTFHSNSRYILYVQLVINDMIMLSCTVLMVVLAYLSYLINVSFCITLILIGINTFLNTPLTLAGMAIERFVAICYPLQHPLICTVHRTYLFIACIWIVGALPGFTDLILTFILNPLSFFPMTKLCFRQNIFTSVYHQNNNVACNIIYMCFVWIILFYTYFKVMFSAKSAASDQALVRKARKTVLLHGVQLAICMLSFMSPILDSGLYILFPQSRSVILFCTYIITNMLPRLLSPLIYGLRDQNFKKHMKRSLLCRRPKAMVKPTADRLQ